MTTRAVERFQRAHHLPVDGIDGRETQRQLGLAVRRHGLPTLQPLGAIPPLARKHRRAKKHSASHHAVAAKGKSHHAVAAKGGSAWTQAASQPAGERRSASGFPVLLAMLGLGMLFVLTVAAGYTRRRGRPRLRASRAPRLVAVSAPRRSEAAQARSATVPEDVANTSSPPPPTASAGRRAGGRPPLAVFPASLVMLAVGVLKIAVSYVRTRSRLRR